MDIVKDDPSLDNKWLPRLGIRFIWGDFPQVPERRCSLMTRIKALLAVLGLLATAALNGATPWGP
jgi:hypothetical protein